MLSVIVLMLSVFKYYTECHYAECHCAECGGATLIG
jgi:hypothetical protein